MFSKTKGKAFALLMILAMMFQLTMFAAVNVSALDIGQKIQLYPSTNSGFINPLTGTKGGNGSVPGEPKGLIGGETLNLTNGIVTVDVAGTNTLVGSGTAPCYSKAAIKFGNNGIITPSGNSVTYKPTFSLLNGYNTKVTYQGIAGSNKTPISALITYNGGQTAEAIITPPSSGYSNGALIPVADLGTYPNVESVTLTAAGSGDTFIYYTEFELVGATTPITPPDPPVIPPPSPIPSFENSFTLYSADNDGILKTGSSTKTTGKISGSTTATGGIDLNGDNGQAFITIPSYFAVEGSGSSKCYGYPAVQFIPAGGIAANVTYTPAAGKLTGVDTTVIYNGIAANSEWSACLMALVTYDGGQTEVSEVYPFGASAGKANGELLVPKVIGTYKDVESVKIYSATCNELYINSVTFGYNSASEPPSENGISDIELLDSTSVVTETFTDAATVNSVKISSQASSEGVLIVAFYKNMDGKSQLKAVDSFDISASDFTGGVVDVPVNLDIPYGSTSVKVMYWEDTALTLKPIFESISK